METIKVNMSPNPLDVQTIHASQNDTEARQWEFELHNNGELIDTSDVKEQLVFKAYKGGTEQLLPENGSTPTTSPFLGNIKYPQGLLADQSFTYRQSPTEEDGLAKITDIKGNTLNWNQISIVPFTEVKSGVTFTRSDDRTALQMSGTSTSTIYKPFSDMAMTTVGHVYYVDKGADSTLFQLYNDNGGISTETNNRRAIGRATAQKSWYFRIPNGTTIDVTAKPMIIDLTQMFGSGNEPTTVEEFTSLFRLPYYAYNQGTLLSFNGNGIKTVGKNLFDFSQFANGTITFENCVLTGTAGQFYTAYSDTVNNGIDLKYPKNTQITISFDARTEQNDLPTGGGLYFVASENGIRVQLATTANNTTAIQHKTVTIPSSRHIDKLGWTYGSNPSNIWHITNFQVEFGTTETEYEPYTSSTLSLPISTYFPNGMKSAGTVYDEITESKAITRVGSVDLGSLDWSYVSAYGGAFQSSGIASVVADSNNPLCAIYTKFAPNSEGVTNTNMGIAINANGNGGTIGGAYGFKNIVITNRTYTDATEFKTAMSGIYLFYELATPTETSFTTASLVTENAEIPLSNNDGVLIGKCTEQLSENPGFIDAKIKLSDSDGECYSNKIQLHVERSPQ